MLRAFLRIITALALGTTAMAAVENPFVLVLVAEPATQSRASEFRAEILKFDPFMRMGEQFVVKIAVMSHEAMKCKAELTTSDTIVCDQAAIQKLARATPYNSTVALAIPDRKFRANSRSVSPSDTSVVVVHEFLHNLGFNDEYAYSKSSEPSQYADCQRLQGQGANTVIFDSPGYFISNADAMFTHYKDIPWVRFIDASTSIVNGTKLGTPAPWFSKPGEDWPGLNVPGLFPVGDCKGSKVWRPFRSTLMRDSMRTSQASARARLPALYKVWIAEAMSKLRGQEIRLDPPIDYECLRKVDFEVATKMPGLVDFEKRLSDRFDAVLPQATNHLPWEVLKMFPEVSELIETLKRYNAWCFSTLRVFETKQGVLFGERRLDPVDLDVRTRSVQLAPVYHFLSHIADRMKQNPRACSARVREKAVAMHEEYAEMLRKAVLNPVFRAAVDRVQGLAEEDWDGLSEALWAQEIPDLDAMIARKILGPELYASYREALRKHHYASPFFNCRAELK